MRLFKLHRRKAPLPSASPVAPSLSSTTASNTPTQASYTITPLPTTSKRASMYSVQEKPLDLSDEPFASRFPTYSPASSRPPSNSSSQHRPRTGGGYSNHKRPALADILADKTAHPWTLAAFTQYAAQNMCDENIEFITHSRRYRDLYNSHEDPDLLDERATEKLRKLWMKIVSTYVASSSPREVNIPGDIRATLVSLHKEHTIPQPQALQPAVKKVMELIEDSIYFPFVAENRPPSVVDTPMASVPPSPSMTAASLASSGNHMTRSASRSRRISSQSANRFSTSALDPPVATFSPSSYPRVKRTSITHASHPSNGSSGGFSVSQLSSSLQSTFSTHSQSHHASPWLGNRNSKQQNPPHTFNQFSYPHSSTSTASVTSSNAPPSLEPTWTDDSGLSVPSPASDSMKSPVNSDPSVSPPDTPESGDRVHKYTTTMMDASNTSWKKLSRGIASLGTIKRRAAEQNGNNIPRSQPAYNVEQRPKLGGRQRTTPSPPTYATGLWYR